MSVNAKLDRVALFGATSAIAQETGRILAGRGASLVVVGRDPHKLSAVADDLRARGAARVDSVQADLDEVGRHAALVDGAAEALGGLDAVVIAQGVLGDQEESARDVAAAERVLVGNFVGPALLAQAAATRLAAQGAGTLVGISSVAGDRGRGSNYTYGAAKGGFSLFLQGLRNRYAPAGVRVLTVKPGFVDTPMTAHLEKSALFATPARVAAGIVRAAERGRDVVYAPGFWRLVMAVIRAIPERIFKRLKL